MKNSATTGLIHDAHGRVGISGLPQTSLACAPGRGVPRPRPRAEHRITAVGRDTTDGLNGRSTFQRPLIADDLLTGVFTAGGSVYEISVIVASEVYRVRWKHSSASGAGIREWHIARKVEKTRVS